MRTIRRDIVSALIFSKDGRLLLGKKDPNKGGVYSDCWHIPGGGIDAGETELDALKRETLEEVGINVTPYSPYLVDDTGTGISQKTLSNGEVVMCKMQFKVYRVDITDKDAKQVQTKSNDDLVRLEWARVKDLKDYKLTPPSVELFKRLRIPE
jgi:8-oxo-dGTP pyrophosphatase MutT (NUDIX family)